MKVTIESRREVEVDELMYVTVDGKRVTLSAFEERWFIGWIEDSKVVGIWYDAVSEALADLNALRKAEAW